MPTSARRSLLVFNAGSSSLKAELFGVYDGAWRSRCRVTVEGVGARNPTLHTDGDDSTGLGAIATHAAAAELVLERLRAAEPIEAPGERVAATAHRIVHGGDVYAAPELVTAAVRERLDALTPLAPLHNPPALEVLDVVRRRFADAPAVAVFDTCFFRDLPAAASTYAIPAAWRRERSVRRFGFHGIAHECLSRGYAVMNGRKARPERVVTLQLGNGCSAAALLRGSPVETSMGYTPLEGLIMGTRPGDTDIGILLELARSGASWTALDEKLNRESGLRGLSETSSDMRELLELEAAGDARAALAIDAFCHRVRKYVGAYAAVLGGLDAVVFGGGIGERSAAVRKRICAGFEWLGLELDELANERGEGTRTIAAAASRVDVAVVEVREERAIARHACERLGLAADGLGP
jgi:acetate kinase